MRKSLFKAYHINIYIPKSKIISMAILDRLKGLYYHWTGRDRFEFKDVGEAFAEWKKRTNEILVYAKEAGEERNNNPLFNAYATQILREYKHIVDNMPPQDVRKLNRLIRNGGIEILVEDDIVRLEVS